LSEKIDIIDGHRQSNHSYEKSKKAKFIIFAFSDMSIKKLKNAKSTTFVKRRGIWRY